MLKIEIVEACDKILDHDTKTGFNLLMDPTVPLPELNFDWQLVKSTLSPH